MNKYIKPDFYFEDADMEPLLSSNSINNVEGVDDLQVSDDEFSGGNADSRNSDLWDD